MFRNPRENLGLPLDNRVDPSVGRPPSPPEPRQSSAAQNARSMPTKAAAARTQTSKVAPVSTKLSQSTLLPSNGSRKGAGPSPSGIKVKAKSNGNIIAFFQKAEELNSTVFVPDRLSALRDPPPVPAEQDVVDLLGDDVKAIDEVDISTEARYNEMGGSNKKRRISHEAIAQACSPPPPAEPTEQVAPEARSGGETAPVYKVSAKKRVGPFVEDSESEEEAPVTKVRRPTQLYTPPTPNEAAPEADDEIKGTRDETFTAKDHRPSLKREATSVVEDEVVEGYDAIENEADYDDEDFMEGEETDERRFLEEQRILELAEGSYNDDDDVLNDMDDISKPSTDTVGLSKVGRSSSPAFADAPACPICGIGLSGVSDNDASVHVNNCLDGKPSPLPTKPVAKPKISTITKTPFQRPDRGARPGQANPFMFGSGPAKSGSAFSKIMANHTEDAAWATAAAAEKEARGKPHYQRTCPFYKIMPGFYIAVDAFRYGAVAGQRAYFLSHFHSDHYVGLTSGWSHGPIYCSKVTANLVKQQLRVAAKWVVPLEFEEKVEVPGTEGVFVTMISANHCPGSSLFLFEKVIGKGKSPKTQRVLHCGDFRACRMHVEHPLLRPDVMDAVGRKVGQQKIDVCYLDTTYLNPKYAFPPQEQVIQACADMCVSLSKPLRDESDGWEQMKRERAGEGMVKFVRTNTDASVKAEDAAEEHTESESPSKPVDAEHLLIKQEPEGHDASVKMDDTPVKGENDAKPMLDATAVLTETNKARLQRSRGRLLVVVGTYSIGKERICMGIARALNSKIYAPPSKQRICAALEDPELNARLTSDPHEAQVHMTPLFEIRADTLDDYLKDYRGSFDRCVGFRPSGWNYRPPKGRFTESPAVSTVLHSQGWKSTFSMRELVPQRGSTSRASCFGVPYSEHSSFRELTMFCCALRIDKIIPTVNVGSAPGRARMKVWCERWAMEKKKNGLFKIEGEGSW